MWSSLSFKHGIISKFSPPEFIKLSLPWIIFSSSVATQSEEKKKGLQEWRKRVGYAKAQEITTEAAGRGTRMHKWLENYVISEDGDMGQYGSNPYSKQSHIMASVIIDKGLVNCDEYWGTEVTLYFPEIYAGTTDLVGVHSGDEAIMDHKQTNRPKKREWIDDYFIQMTAYADAHNVLYGEVSMNAVEDFHDSWVEFANDTAIVWNFTKNLQIGMQLQFIRRDFQIV